MRIVQVANFVTPTSGGLRTAIDALRAGYEANGWEVFRVTPLQEIERQNIIGTIPSWGVPMMNGYRVIISRQAVKEAITKIQPNIIEVSDKTTFSWLPRWAKAQGIPCFVISHERTDLVVKTVRGISGFLQLLVNFWRRQVATSATAIICASHFAAEEFDDSNCTPIIIPLGAHIENLAVKRSRPRDNSSIRVVMCCRLSPEKFPFVTFEAVRELSASRSIELVVMGDGPLRDSLQSSYSDINVDFRGFVSRRSDVFAELANADVVVNLGPIETFGLSTIEALSCGTPVVVADAGASRELISEVCGRAVSLEPSVVARAIEELASMSSESLSETCKTYASRYTWDKTIDKYVDLYHSTLGISRNVAR